MAEAAEKAAREGEGEERECLVEKVSILDFDMLCASVTVQSQKGMWGPLNREDGGGDEERGYGNGGFRMWEGELVHDCFEDRRIALQSACCPCYRFGKNMRRAGFGSCFLQGTIYVILVLLALINILAFIVTGKHYFMYFAVACTVTVGLYLGIFRTQIRKKFNIRDSDSTLDDCLYHLACPCCSLCQESRTLEMNNVQDGIWHGRGDTICIGSSGGAKAYFERNIPQIMSRNSPEPEMNSKATNEEARHSDDSMLQETSPLV